MVEPIFEGGFIDHTFANRTGKGTHRAIDAYERYRNRHAYVLRGDIYRYFPAIEANGGASPGRTASSCNTPACRLADALAGDLSLELGERAR